MIMNHEEVRGIKAVWLGIMNMEEVPWDQYPISLYPEILSIPINNTMTVLECHDELVNEFMFTDGWFSGVYHVDKMAEEAIREMLNMENVSRRGVMEEVKDIKTTDNVYLHIGLKPILEE